MRSRNKYSCREDEPKAIAISATKERNHLLPFWFAGLAVVAYLGCVVVLY